jgi:hypothetical protein
MLSLALQAIKTSMKELDDGALLTHLKTEYRALFGAASSSGAVPMDSNIPFEGLKLAAAKSPTHVNFARPTAETTEDTKSDGSGVVIIALAVTLGVIFVALLVMIVVHKRHRPEVSKTPATQQGSGTI